VPLPIQRTPRGLSDVLSIFGGLTPRALADEARGVVDLLQFYGLSQQNRLQATNAALTLGNGVELIAPSNQWWLVFSVGYVCVKTATMTNLRVSLQVGPGQGLGFGTVFAEQHAQFGAAFTGTVSNGIQ